MKCYIVSCLDCNWASVEQTREAARQQVRAGGTKSKPHKMQIYKTWAPIKWSDHAE